MKRNDANRQTPYHQVDPSQMILRDQLALDRTLLANERTVLAYVRTAIGVAITGIMLLRLFRDSNDPWWGRIGGALLGVAGVVAVFGFVRFQSVRKRLAPILEHEEKPE